MEISTFPKKKAIDAYGALRSLPKEKKIKVDKLQRGKAKRGEQIEMEPEMPVGEFKDLTIREIVKREKALH